MTRYAALLVLAAAACASAEQPTTGTYNMTSLTYSSDNNFTVAPGAPAPLDPSRPVAERDCSRPIDIGGGNLRCR